VAVPLRETVCGLPGALSAIETVPFRLPVVVGENITLMVQFAPDARVEPQVLVSWKFALAAILEIVSVALPELVSVMGIDWLAVPTISSPGKVRAVVDKEATGDPAPIDPPPQPLRRNHPQSRGRKYFFIVPPLGTKGGRAFELEFPF
jgi:hypothetical protein